MIDLGISKMAMIGAVALIVIGPEKLPKVARTVGAILGKAQRYVADVKAEVNEAMSIDELKKMKDTVESAGREVEAGIRGAQADLEKNWSDVKSTLNGTDPASDALIATTPQYHHPRKNWRLRRGATPRWYKSRRGLRTHVQSGAARVARYRPHN